MCSFSLGEPPQDSAQLSVEHMLNTWGARTHSPWHMQVLWLNCLALAGREQLGRATPETVKN